jgi:CheY-like chemotaxis protein
MKLKRILLVDDNAEIHTDFYKILTKHEGKTLDKDEEVLFGIVKAPSITSKHQYRLDSAYQGEEALEFVKKSLQEDDRYALAFIDMRMPPGLNGIETIKGIWELDPSIPGKI